MLRIELRKEVGVKVVNGRFIIPNSENGINVYACTDGISCYIATVKTVEELNEVIAPENLLDVMVIQASEDEIVALDAELFSDDYKYLSYDGKTILTAVH